MSEPVPDSPFVHRRRVEYGDLDANAHVNNVTYLRYFETARIEFVSRLFGDHDPSRPPGGQGLIFAECHVAYRSPAVYGEEIATAIRVGEVRRSSFRVEFTMEAGARLVAEGWGALVGYDYEEGRARPLPAELRERLAAAAGDGRGAEPLR